MPGPVFDHDLEMLNERSTLDEGETRVCHTAAVLLACALNWLAFPCSVLRGTRIVPAESWYTIMMVLKVTFLDGAFGD